MRHPADLLVAAAGLALLVVALVAGKSGAPAFIGDEATYAMAADSMVHDFDVRYTSADLARFRATWGRGPDGLILQSPDGGENLYYSKPLLYPALIAPISLVAPARGPILINALLLAAATWLLYRYLGSVSNDWVAAVSALAMPFATVAFAYTTWIHADLLQFFLLAAALYLWLAERAPRPVGVLPDVYEDPFEETAGLVPRAAAAAALLGAATYGRLPAALFALALFFDLARLRRGRALAAAFLAFVVVAGGLTLAQRAATGAVNPYYAPRVAFYDYTGYPLADKIAFASHEEAQGTRWGQRGTIPVKWNERLFGWDLLYYAAGRNTGLVPYFGAAVVFLLAWFVRGPHDPPRTLLALAFLGSVAFYLLLRPHNYFGGGGSIGNRYFLSFAPAAFFLVTRVRTPLAAILSFAIAAPFLHLLWRHPAQAPVGRDGSYAYATTIARQYLPYETTQSHIPDGRDLRHQGLWLRFLDGNVRVQGEKLSLRSGHEAQVLIAVPEPLDPLDWSFPGTAADSVDVAVGRTRNLVRTGALLRSLPGRPSRRHPMWWSEENWWLYLVSLRAGAPGQPGHDVWLPWSVRPAGAAIEIRGVRHKLDVRKGTPAAADEQDEPAAGDKRSKRRRRDRDR